MKTHPLLRTLLAFVAALVAGYAGAQELVSIPGAACAKPPVLHCPDAECSGPTVINPGPVVEMKTRRTSSSTTRAS
jgi:hypothetical protein